MTALLDSLYPGDDVTLLVVNVLIQVTAVILLTMFVVRKFLRRQAAAGHAAWLACLAFVAVCPLIVFAANRSGMSIVSLPLGAEAAATNQGEMQRTPSAVATTTIATADPARPQGAVPGKGPSNPTLTLKPSIPPTAERLTPAEDTRFEMTDRVTAPVTERPPDGLQPAAAAALTTPGATGPLVFRSAVSIAVAIWATGALLLSVRLLYGAFYLHKLGRATTPLDESALADVLKRVRRSLGVATPPASSFPSRSPRRSWQDCLDRPSCCRPRCRNRSAETACTTFSFTSALTLFVAITGLECCSDWWKSFTGPTRSSIT